MSLTSCDDHGDSGTPSPIKKLRILIKGTDEEVKQLEKKLSDHFHDKNNYTKSVKLRKSPPASHVEDLNSYFREKYPEVELVWKNDNLAQLKGKQMDEAG